MLDLRQLEPPSVLVSRVFRRGLSSLAKTSVRNSVQFSAPISIHHMLLNLSSSGILQGNKLLAVLALVSAVELLDI